MINLDKLMIKTFLQSKFILRAIYVCLTLSFYQQKIFAQNCNFYPEFEGVRVKTLDKKGNFKLVSTKKEKVSSSYLEDVLNATSLAKLNARIEALRFIESDLVGDKRMHPAKVVDQNDLQRQFKMMPLFDMCYEPGKFVIVSIEISPSTIKLAN